LFLAFCIFLDFKHNLTIRINFVAIFTVTWQFLQIQCQRGNLTTLVRYSRLWSITSKPVFLWDRTFFVQEDVYSCGVYNWLQVPFSLIRLPDAVGKLRNVKSISASWLLVVLFVSPLLFLFLFLSPLPLHLLYDLSYLLSGISDCAYCQNHGHRNHHVLDPAEIYFFDNYRFFFNDFVPVWGGHLESYFEGFVLEDSVVWFCIVVLRLYNDVKVVIVIYW